MAASTRVGYTRPVTGAGGTGERWDDGSLSTCWLHVSGDFLLPIVLVPRACRRAHRIRPVSARCSLLLSNLSHAPILLPLAIIADSAGSIPEIEDGTDNIYNTLTAYNPQGEQRMSPPR